ncbi:hypothetical protein N836_30280 [Leptolyngbya sp. Heron Island J]|uniref:hypothetical protein n=1 Tax=Leptolyngbya sp. Heron Island J TaxID=1385935 RepID=UPI0003B9E0F0|nr:hypothetical protein [Leptolyngbya sp. Heron Island J]ESA38817.1 hypothetical protein N836_30280 [Leptolyngbya sp. Heron Island J]
MFKKDFKVGRKLLLGAVVISVISLGCSSSEDVEILQSGTFGGPPALKVSMFDAKNPDPTEAGEILLAQIGTDVIFQEEYPDGKWVKVEIRNMKLWVDKGSLQCTEFNLGHSCTLK